jgi:AAA domain
MKTLSQIPRTSPKHICIYGPPKAGKTALAGTVASKYKVIWFDLENGYETLFQLPPEAQDNITLIRLADTRGFPIGIETCLKVIKGGSHRICDTHGKINCPVCAKNPEAEFTEINLSSLPPDTVVVFDSLTQLTNSAISHITKNQPEDYKLEYDDWGNLGKLMDIFLSHVQQAPFHVICISHETEAEFEDGKAKVVPTAGTRNFSRNTARYFSSVIYCEVKNGRHIAGSTTTYSPKVLTGTRSGISLEGSATNSLIPILEGKVPESQAAATQNSPATKAVSSLQSLQSRLANTGVKK